MGSFVQPEVYLVAGTALDMSGMLAYLKASSNEDFLEAMDAAFRESVSQPEVLVSAGAKLCYSSLSEGKNKNVSRVRDIPGNFCGTLAQGHGSVLEHSSCTFVARNVSRVFTHELVRHRVGSAFSQTSGRYVRTDEVNIVFDPILEPIRAQCERMQALIESGYGAMESKLMEGVTDMAEKKRRTSALRRFLPNGQANEIMFTLNFRSLRHTVQARTSRHAEWEIRQVFARVYQLTKALFPLLYSDAREEEVLGCTEVTCMRMQPYDVPSMRLGDYVVSVESDDPLRCCSGVYSGAVVVSEDPFVLVSVDGDMLWRERKRDSVRGARRATADELRTAMMRWFREASLSRTSG